MSGFPGCEIANAKTALREEARGRHERDGDDEGECHGAVPRVEPRALEHVGLEVEDRHPDPHRRQDLDERQPPVVEQQPQPVEEHHERADGERERREDPSRPAQRDHGGLDGCLSSPSRIARTSAAFPFRRDGGRPLGRYDSQPKWSPHWQRRL